jgi:hypothetical protein
VRFAERSCVSPGIENPRVGGSIPSLGTTFLERNAGSGACQERQVRAWPVDDTITARPRPSS